MESLKETKLACITMQSKLPDIGDNRGKRHELAFRCLLFSGNSSFGATTYRTCLLFIVQRWKTLTIFAV
jgi:hypothetical protein